MRNRRGRRIARLAALGVAAGTLWLAGQTADLSALRAGLSDLLAGPGTAAALLAQELTPAQNGQLLEDWLLGQLPAPAGDEPSDTAEADTTVQAELPEAEAAEAPSAGTEEVPAADGAAEEGSTAEETTAEDSSPAEDGPEEEQAPDSSADSEGSGAEEETEGEAEAPSPDGAQEYSVLPAPEDISGDQLELTNSTDGIELSLGDYLAREVNLSLSSEGPQILIMHTHGTEAYTMADGDNYVESDSARTTDENYNMIRVGEEMKNVFESMGLSVVHDTSLYDYPRYTGSYSRSLDGIEAYLEQYPTISVVLDVHRDALIGNDGTAYKVTDTIDGETVAQVMLVVGSNDGGLDHPNWEENLTLAAHIQARMMGIHSSFPRPINLRSQRFNQHMTPASLLVEVGTSGNTLREALAGARYFAQAAGSVYLEHLSPADGG